MALGSSNITNVLTLGGVGNPNPLVIAEGNSQGYFTLEASGNGAASFFHFYKNGVVYQVTAGKTCKVVSVSYSGGSSGDQNIQLMSATNNFTDGVGSGSITGGVFQYGAAGNYGGPSVTAFQWYTLAQTYDFAATTYPGFQSHNASRNTIFLIAKEV